MPYKIEALPDEQIILVTYIHPLDPVNDTRNALNDQVKVLQTWEKFPAYVIVDFSKTVVDFGSIVAGLGEVRASAIGQQLNQYEMVTLFVGRGEMVKLAAESAQQDQYGAFKVQFFASVDEARQHVKAALG